MTEKEDFVYVLDYLPEGKYIDYKRVPIVQGVGTERFSLLQMVPKEGVALQPLEKVFVGKGERDKIALVKGIISYNELTENAKAFLEKALEKLIEEKKDKFLLFFNKSGAVSLRLHALELLPGVGKKNFQDLLGERQKKPFESFEEISERAKSFPNPRKAIVERIVQEMKGAEKYYLFARAPKQERHF